MKPITGAQLYTVRDYTKTIEDVRETFRRVREIGYTSVQISGFGPVDPRQVADALKEHKLSCGVTHMGWDKFLNDLDGVIETHKLWNCSHTAIGGLPREYGDARGLERFITELRPIAARLKAEGMDLSYHNHNQEFRRINGSTWLGKLFADTSAEEIKAELDTYWVQAGGGSPEQWIRCLAGRIPVLHLKDMCIHEFREQRFAPIGEGNLDWPAILKAAEEGGCEYLMVEQDDCYGRDPFEELAISYRNLKAMGYE